MSANPFDGPWRTIFEDECVVVDVDGARVAETTNGYIKETREAHARLIAAAPEMYAYVRTRAEAGDTEAQAIIAKAEGRS